MTVRRRTRAASLAVSMLALAACQSVSPSPHATTPPVQPYAGLQTRPIPALDPERVTKLLDGRGAGYALAAELNHYPGPMHVLELARQLELRPDQEREAKALQLVMKDAAVPLGRRLVDLEMEMDSAFRSGHITPERLAALTSEIAGIEGQLRNIHLAAHLQTRKFLTQEQVATYDRLRGYTGTATEPSETHRG